MKKYTYPAYLLLLLITCLSACKKNDPDYFGKTPTERSTEALSKYQTQLTSAPNGWKAILYPNGGGVYLFSIKFGADNRVSMLSDIDEETSTTSNESGYTVKQLQAPSLVFDTYSYIHLLSDPTPALPDGNKGSGYSSDFEFSFDKMSGDTITLIGNKKGSKLTLVKAKTTAEYTSFTTGTSTVFTTLNAVRTYFKRVTIGTTACELNIDKGNKLLSLSYLDGGTNLKTVSSAFYIDGSTNSIILSKPLLVDKTSITAMEKIVGDAANHTVNLSVSNNAIQIKEATAPLKVDITAPKRWHDQMNLNFNGTWVSTAAFHFGVDDYCNFSNVPGYSGLWYAGPSVFGGTSEGVISFVNNQLVTPYALTSTFTYPEPGVGRFTLLGSTTGFTASTPLALAMKAARGLLYKGAIAGSSEDWYFIQTNAAGTAYDMVRVSDAQVWISWKPRG